MSTHYRAQVEQLKGNVVLMLAPGGGTVGAGPVEVYACPGQ